MPNVPNSYVPDDVLYGRCERCEKPLHAEDRYDICNECEADLEDLRESDRLARGYD